MRVFPIPLILHVRGLIQRAPSSRFYVVSALAQKNFTVSHSKQVKEGNFDCNVMEFNEIGVRGVLNSMKDDPYGALSFLQRIEGNGALPSVQAYADVIKIVCSWGLGQKLDSLLVELIRKGDKGRGFTFMDLLKSIVDLEVSVVLLTRVSSALVKAYANLQMFEEAVDIFFQPYYSLGHAPDIKALNFLMHCMIASGKTDMVAGVFWEIERLGLDVDAQTYVLVVQALYRNKDIEGIEKLLNRRLNSETRNPCVFYIDFIEGLCLNQMTDIAYLLLQPLRNANILVDKRDLGIAYRKVVHGLCHEMKIEVAENAVLDMEELGIDPGVYVYSAIIKMGKFAEAYDLFKEFRELNIPDRVCYNVAFDALGKLGEVEEAILLFREMKVKGVAPDIINYTTLISGCCQQGMVL